MDATVQTTTPDRRLARTTRILVFVAIAIVFALGAGLRATLVDPIPLPMTFFAGAAGFGAGCWLIVKLMKIPSSQDRWKRTLGLIAMPIFGLLIGTFLARVAVEAVAFAGLDPPETPIQAHVENGGLGRYGGQYAEVSFGPGTRSVYVEISSDLYDQLDPTRAPGRDCIVLAVQTGRLGLRRTMLPRRFFDDPIGEDHYRRCGP